MLKNGLFAVLRLCAAHLRHAVGGGGDYVGDEQGVAFFSQRCSGKPACVPQVFEVPGLCEVVAQVDQYRAGDLHRDVLPRAEALVATCLEVVKQVGVGVPVVTVQVMPHHKADGLRGAVVD